MGRSLQGDTGAQLAGGAIEKLSHDQDFGRYWGKLPQAAQAPDWSQQQNNRQRSQGSRSTARARPPSVVIRPSQGLAGVKALLESLRQTLVRGISGIENNLQLERAHR